MRAFGTPGGARGMWSRRVIPVPTSALQVDVDVAENSPKGYTQAQLDAIAANIPLVYDRLKAGAQPQDLLDARTSPDSDEQRVGNTYAHLFAMTPQSEVMAADLSGGQLMVSKGNHRIRAAQRGGVAYVPVQVAAETPEELDRLTAGYAAAGGPEYANLMAVHVEADRTRAQGADRGAVREVAKAGVIPARATSIRTRDRG